MSHKENTEMLSISPHKENINMEINVVSGTSSTINARMCENRHKYFKRLAGTSYLDHAGATQYSDLHMTSYCQDLTSSVYGNPHSGSDSSVHTTDVVSSVRTRVLQHFNTTAADYTVIFTGNCTAALRLVADSFLLQNCGNQDVMTSGSHGSRAVQHNRPSANNCETCGKITGDSYNCNNNVTAQKNQAAKECEQSVTSLLHSSISSQVRGATVDENVLYKLSNCDKNCSSFVHLDDNHTSVLGMRRVLAERGAEISCLTPEDMNKFLSSGSSENKTTVRDCRQHQHSDDENCEMNHNSRVNSFPSSCIKINNNLFAFPAQSNFNGRRYPLEWTSRVGCCHNHSRGSCHNRWFVLLDAASLLTTSTIDLQQWKPDFVTLSFYKMFGFPTGLGALIVKNSSSQVLKRSYFGGGTVEVSLASEDFHVSRRDLSQRFEDGTLPFLEILAVKHGFNTLETVAGSITDISVHTFRLAQSVFRQLSQWRHSNGQPLAILYHDSRQFDSIETQGPIVNFNLLRPNGSFVGFVQVERLASLYGIHLRTGCFCNMGACQRHLHLTTSQIIHNYESGHVCGDSMDLVDGLPTGSVRISFGFSSTDQDAQTFLRFVKDCFVDVSADDPDRLSSRQENTDSVGQAFESDPVTLIKIQIFPVKSCAAVEVSTCGLDVRGLRHDRRFMIVTESGACFSQKRSSCLCLIKPLIDTTHNCVVLSYADSSSSSEVIEVVSTPSNDVSGSLCTAKVCGDRIRSADCGDAVAHWLQTVLNVQGIRLYRQLADDTRHVSDKHDKSLDSVQLSLANEAQFLLVATASIEALLSCILQQAEDTSRDHRSQLLTVDELIERFRPNLVVRTSVAFEEETWSTIMIGNNVFQSQGRCNRCQMICIDQRTGFRTVEPLRSLNAWPNRKCTFGVLLRRVTEEDENNAEACLKVGDIVRPLSFLSTA